MKKFEWGVTTQDEGNVLLVDDSTLDKFSEGNHPDLKEIVRLTDLGLDGYVDGSKAYKITDPSITASKGNVKLNRVTLPKGVDSFMSDKADSQYSELKEDLRDSERRISSDFKEREQRLEKEIIRREERFEKSLEKFAIDAKEREERYIKNIEEVKKIVANGETNRKSTTIAIWTLAITTILGIAAMIVTVLVSLN